MNLDVVKGVAPQRESVTVYICRSAKRWPWRRPQRWFWRAVAANGRTLARSSETYTNRGDCVAMARKLFQPSRPWPVVDRWDTQ